MKKIQFFPSNLTCHRMAVLSTPEIIMVIIHHLIRHRLQSLHIKLPIPLHSLIKSPPLRRQIGIVRLISPPKLLKMLFRRSRVNASTIQHPGHIVPLTRRFLENVVSSLQKLLLSELVLRFHRSFDFFEIAVRGHPARGMVPFVIDSVWGGREGEISAHSAWLGEGCSLGVRRVALGLWRVFREAVLPDVGVRGDSFEEEVVGVGLKGLGASGKNYSNF